MYTHTFRRTAPTRWAHALLLGDRHFLDAQDCLASAGLRFIEHAAVGK